ncbi:MAG: amidohydrolase family protein, partial [Acidobacteria bacterium]|nr:amidohydrolase family protein [Acidobacteriota bacterium]
MKIYSADNILPISDEPIKGGAVLVRDGRIAAIGEKNSIAARFPETEIEEFGDAVIMPGFVNAHSHLELSILRGFLDAYDDDFSSWLIKLTNTRREKLDERDIELSAMFGALEGITAGVTCFADIGRYGEAGFRALCKTRLRGILFQETEFSPDSRTANVDFEKLSDKFESIRQRETDLVKVG